MCPTSNIILYICFHKCPLSKGLTLYAAIVPRSLPSSRWLFITCDCINLHATVAGQRCRHPTFGHPVPLPGVRTRISPGRRRLSCSFGALDALGCRNPACQRAWLAAAQPGSHGGWINAHGGPSCVPLIVATLCSSDVSSPDARTHAGLALLQAGRRATCVAEGTIDGQWLLAGSECDGNGKKRGDDDARSDWAEYSEQLLEWRARPG